MKKKALFIIALVCAVAQGAWAESVTFNVRSWDATTKQVVTLSDAEKAKMLQEVEAQQTDFGLQK